MTIQMISTDSPAYEQMVDLRMEVLLNPIGIPRTYINPEKESQDILIAAFEDNQLLGCCILTHCTKNSMQLRQMAVKQNIQRSGIGASIVAFAENKAKELGYKTLFMHSRDAVISFYEKQGYKIDGEGFTEVNIPHHKMEKELWRSNQSGLIIHNSFQQLLLVNFNEYRRSYAALPICFKNDTCEATAWLILGYSM